MGENGQQGDEAAVAPADHSHSFWIDFPMCLQHELSRGLNVFDFQSTVINHAPELDAIAAAATIVGGDHGIAMLDQFANNDCEIVRGDVTVNFRVSQNDER